MTWVKPMETGYLAKLEQAADLAKGIALLIEDDELLARMSSASRRIAETDYSQELQARRHEELYREVISRRLPQLIPNSSN